MEKYVKSVTSPEAYNRFGSEPETSVEQEVDRVNVYIRIRPAFQHEKGDLLCVSCAD